MLRCEARAWAGGSGGAGGPDGPGGAGLGPRALGATSTTSSDRAGWGVDLRDLAAAAHHESGHAIAMAWLGWRVTAMLVWPSKSRSGGWGGRVMGDAPAGGVPIDDEAFRILAGPAAEARYFGFDESRYTFPLCIAPTDRRILADLGVGDVRCDQRAAAAMEQAHRFTAAHWSQIEMLAHVLEKRRTADQKDVAQVMRMAGGGPGAPGRCGRAERGAFISGV